MDEMPHRDFHIGAPPPAPEPASRPAKRRRTGLFVGLIALAVLVLLAGGGLLVWVVLTKTPAGDVVASAVESPLVSAQKKCAPGNSYAEIGDGGNTLMLQSEGEEDPGISYTQLKCFLDELKVSDAVRSEIGQTRALDGKQNGEWGKFKASWRYHPDSGLNMVVTMP
ncbi:hypothetical protein [Catellatospora methionotrophica]|uniref:hypothetical protein n=1 Tax=Catellatospora methionotrophica TaxID=121620 RepID=UPI0033C13A9D